MPWPFAYDEPATALVFPCYPTENLIWRSGAPQAPFPRGTAAGKQVWLS